jgi:poly-gamma-glutamate synthesis protein (capsule biosynthesis protein)
VYGKGAPPQPAPAAGSNRFKYFDNWFEAGPNPGAMNYEINANDEQDILASIRNGKVYADFLIATVHAHQLTFFSTAPNTEVEHNIPEFLIKLAHDAIDAGADMFISHGMHALRGIEIYKGKPIFYGLSNFIFEYGLQLNGTDVLDNERQVQRLENPIVNESIQTMTTFDGGKLKEIRLYPVDLGGAHRPISQVGIPLESSAEDAARILQELDKLSRPLGTTIKMANGVGVIQFSDSASAIH